MSDLAMEEIVLDDDLPRIAEAYQTFRAQSRVPGV